MKSLIFTLSLLSGTFSFAQAIPMDCQFEVNPHSYACTRWTFEGNQMFPLNQMDWSGVLQGSWMPLTFSGPDGGNDNDEFSMLKNPRRPTIPEGVIDRTTGQKLGDMTIQGGGAFFQNWHGFQFWSLRNSLVIPDAFTARFQFQDQGGQQTFNCRDFNRNNTHHLLCAWDSFNTQSQQWMHHGFLGFLKRAN